MILAAKTVRIRSNIIRGKTIGSIDRSKQKVCDRFRRQLLGDQIGMQVVNVNRVLTLDHIIRINELIKKSNKEQSKFQFPRVSASTRRELELSYFSRMMALSYIDFDDSQYLVQQAENTLTAERIELTGLTLLGMIGETSWDERRGLIARFRKSFSNGKSLLRSQFQTKSSIRIRTEFHDSFTPISSAKGIIVDVQDDYIDVSLTNSNIGFISPHALYRLDVAHQDVIIKRISDALSIFLDGMRFPESNGIKDFIVSTYPSSTLKLASLTGGLRNGSLNSKYDEMDENVKAGRVDKEILRNQLNLSLTSSGIERFIQTINKSKEGADVIRAEKFLFEEELSEDKEEEEKKLLDDAVVEPSIPTDSVLTEQDTTAVKAAKDVEYMETKAFNTIESLFLNARLFSKNASVPVFREGTISDTLSKLKIELNRSQFRAAKQAISSPITLIQGPPGTGKTRTAAAILAVLDKLQEQAMNTAHGSFEMEALVSNSATYKPRNHHHLMLACAQTNAAADNIVKHLTSLGVSCIRLGRTNAMHPDSIPHSLEHLFQINKKWLIAQDDYRQSWQNYVNSQQHLSFDEVTTSKKWVNSSGDHITKVEEYILEKALREVDVVVSTCAGAGMELLQGFMWSSKSRSYRFSTVLVDEASQVTEAGLFPAINMGCERLILIGDQNQLPPLVVSETANRIGAAVSLFNRLVVAGLSPVLLNTQYRMSPTIASFASTNFYRSALKSATDSTQLGHSYLGILKWPNLNSRVLFVNMSPKLYLDKSSKKGIEHSHIAAWTKGFERQKQEIHTFNYACWNDMEANTVVALLDTILMQPRSSHLLSKIGIISPYRTQVDRIRQRCIERGWIHKSDELSKPTLSSSESFFDTDDDDLITSPYLSTWDAESEILSVLDRTKRNESSFKIDSNKDSLESDIRVALSRYKLPKSYCGTKAGPQDLLEVDTVDAFQGREKDVIIISTVRSNDSGAIGFLEDWRRLNVAVTRAKQALIVIGDMETLKHDLYWKSFLDYCGAFRNVIHVDSLDIKEITYFHNDLFADFNAKHFKLTEEQNLPDSK